MDPRTKPKPIAPDPEPLGPAHGGFEDDYWIYEQQEDSDAFDRYERDLEL